MVADGLLAGLGRAYWGCFMLGLGAARLGFLVGMRGWPWAWISPPFRQPVRKSQVRGWAAGLASVRLGGLEVNGNQGAVL